MIQPAKKNLYILDEMKKEVHIMEFEGKEEKVVIISKHGYTSNKNNDHDNYICNPTILHNVKENNINIYAITKKENNSDHNKNIEEDYRI